MKSPDAPMSVYSNMHMHIRMKQWKLETDTLEYQRKEALQAVVSG